MQQYPEERPITDIEECRGANDRVPPHSTELEQQVIGAMLLSRQAISRSIEIPDEQAFYRGRHRHMYTAISNMYEDGRPSICHSLPTNSNVWGCLRNVVAPRT